ncbi:hypothetical protein ACHQM5_028953 [Ranunculus cassubicifolius]
MDSGSLVQPQDPTLLAKRVEELSINCDEPPPSFIRRDDDDTPTNESPSLSIPVIDLHLLSSSSSTAREKELEKLKLAFTSCGFLLAIGHDIPSSVLDDIRKVSKAFFAQPVEEKNKYSVKYEGKVTFLQGYGNDLIISDEQVIEWSDRLFLVVKPKEQRDYHLWSDNPTDFRDVLGEYSMKAHLAAEIILKSMSKSLGLEEKFFVNPVEENAYTFARFNYFPPSSRPDLVYGIKPHSDGGAITLVLQDKDVGGLQVLKDGQWINVPIVPDAVLVFVADQVEIMSNGVFKSPVHRVLTNSERKRFSLAMFYGMENGKYLEPAADLISETTPRLYKKIKAEDYGEIYAKQYLLGKRGIDLVRL